MYSKRPEYTGKCQSCFIYTAIYFRKQIEIKSRLSVIIIISSVLKSETTLLRKVSTTLARAREWTSTTGPQTLMKNRDGIAISTFTVELGKSNFKGPNKINLKLIFML